MELEKVYTNKTSLEHRKKFAQFFTPKPIANLMADWLLGNKSLQSVLEPAFGLGVFSRVLLSKNDRCSKDELQGGQLSPVYL